MEDFMDTVWFKIVDGVNGVAGCLDTVFAVLHPLGPTLTVSIIALLTVLVQKQLTRWYRPKRYEVLRQRYHELRELRDEAMKWEDREQAGRLARNIDQAALNQAYYNYFFEGLMINLLTKYLPFFSMLAYVNNSYRGERLLEIFGQAQLFTIGGLRVGSVFWMTICVLLIHVVWFFVAPRLRRSSSKSDTTTD